MALEILHRLASPITKWRRKKNFRSRPDPFIKFIFAQNMNDIGMALSLKLRDRANTLIKSSLSIIDKIKLDLLNGNHQSAEQHVDTLVNTQPIPSLLTEAAVLIASINPEKALELITRQPILPDCAAAIALNNNRPELARDYLSVMDPLHRDNYLIQANLVSDTAKKLEALNQYLASFKLSPVGVHDLSKPPCMTNLKKAESLPNNLKSQPLVSIILPCHNSARFIEACVHSILQQSYSNFELIIIDDASQDNTWEIIQVLAQQDARIQLKRFDKNVGAFVARNYGLAKAKGKYVTFQDSDDWSHPDRILRCVKNLKRNPELIAVSTKYTRVNDDGYFGYMKVWPLTLWAPITIMFKRKPVMRKIGYFESVTCGADSQYVAHIKAEFGEARHKLIGAPLMIASMRNDSLTTAADTGFDNTGFSDDRIRHQEAWVEKLIHKIQRGDSLYHSR